jgi:hypothetical protein
MPDDSLGSKLLIEVIGPRERARLEVEELDADFGNPAERQVGHGGAVNGFDVICNRLVGPRAARHDHNFIKVPAQHFDSRAMMQPWRVEASSINGKRFRHEYSEGWKDSAAS